MEIRVKVGGVEIEYKEDVKQSNEARIAYLPEYKNAVHLVDRIKELALVASEIDKGMWE